MNEYIEIRFRRNGKPFPLKRQLPGGIEFDEPDPLERTVGITFDAASAGNTRAHEQHSQGRRAGTRGSSS